MNLVPPTDETGEAEIPRTAQVIRLRTITRLDSDPDQTLQAAIGKLSTVVIVGYDRDGREYFAGSISDGADVLWHLERAKLKILTIGTDTPIA